VALHELSERVERAVLLELGHVPAKSDVALRKGPLSRPVVLEEDSELVLESLLLLVLYDLEIVVNDIHLVHIGISDFHFGDFLTLGTYHGIIGPD
jgi:hypothetical protein